MSLNIQEAKDRLRIPDLWRELDLPGHAGKCVKSPFRTEKEPSFSVFDDGRKWKDHGTGERGDAVDFMALALDLQIGSKEALTRFCEIAGITDTPDAEPYRYKAKPSTTPQEEIIPWGEAFPVLDDWKLLEKIASAVERLGDHDTFIKRICAEREWSTCHFRNFIAHGDLALIEMPGDAPKKHPRWPDKCLAFVYATGIKGRWRQTDGKRLVRWLIGGKSIWRLQHLTDPACSINRVFLAEGETDAITLQSLGFGEEGLVCSLPDANYYLSQLDAEILKGKEVLLCFDNDKAGIAATDRIARQLANISQVKVLDWASLAPECEPDKSDDTPENQSSTTH